MGKTHLSVGFLAALLGIHALQPANQVMFLMIALFASLLPDIDHPNAKIGRHVKIIGFLFEHRGFFHSIWAIAFFTLLVHIATANLVYSMAFMLGYASHILVDCLTPRGIMLLHPLSKFKIRGFVTTGGVIEYLIFVFLVLINIWQVLKI